MGEGLCEHCGHTPAQCQCGKLAGEAIHLKVNFDKLFHDWWAPFTRKAFAEGSCWEGPIKDDDGNDIIVPG